MKRREAQKIMAQKERAGDFHAHLKSPSYARAKPVGDDFCYFPSGFWGKVGAFITVRLFFLVGFLLSFGFRLRVRGRRNLRGVKCAVFTSNHINIFDCALIRYGVGRRKLKITVAPFNNYRGPFGAMLRAGGTLPMGTTFAAGRNFSRAVGSCLSGGESVLFYPEGSLWRGYEKPRPLLDGAFYAAARAGVPVVPLFFTFRVKKRNGKLKKKMILHICPPVYPDAALSAHENTARLRLAVNETYLETYRNTYGREPAYLSDETCATVTQ